MARSGFKMKYSPAKGKLGDFFSSLGKQLKSNRKGIDEVYAEKRSRKPGESKFQADVRRKKEANKAKRASWKADAEYYGSAEDKAKNIEASKIKPTVTEEPKSKAYVPQEFKGAPGDKYRYRKTGETVVGDDRYSNFEFMKPGSNTWTKAGENKRGGYGGFNAIWDLHEKAKEEGTLFDSPIDKKLPTKKKGFKMPGYGKRK